MNYKETVEWLYEATPQFQRIGAAAYKPGLSTAIALAEAFGNPEHQFKSVHVAGTNGKGSTCHTLAAIFQSAGYKTGLYTSPHLVDFRERIKIDGEMISENGVVDFVKRWRAVNSELKPSFFELTTVMAFDWFARNNVDIAIIETGLGGRLDTTSIITPQLSIITNISFDHQAQLGNTLASIAAEKAGIIKRGTPVVIGNSRGVGVKDVFVSKGAEMDTELIFADQTACWQSAERLDDKWIYRSTEFGDVVGELGGDCQPENAATVMCAVRKLRSLGWKLNDEAVIGGFANVVELTGLSGRWMKVCDRPTVICDTGHNEGGWSYLGPKMKTYGKGLNMVLGFVNDKDVDHILGLMPREANYFFAKASVPRAMDSQELARRASAFGLEGKSFDSVEDAVVAALNHTAPDGMVFVGGSTFVVADLLALSNGNHFDFNKDLLGKVTNSDS